MIRKILLTSVALVCAQPALAATWTFSLSVDGSSGTNMGAGPFGTITVTENAGKLDFVETLAAGYHINQGNANNHFAFFFSLLGDPAVTITNLTSGYTAANLTSGSNVSAPPFGSFATNIICSGCGPGYNGGLAGPLSFTVGVTGQTLTLASLLSNTYNGQQIYFASDLVSSTGVTGNVGAVRVANAVPEPATWGMMLLGFGGLGYAMRRRPKVATRVRFA